MNGAMFLILLAVCGIVTSLVTEIEKKLFSNFPVNIIAILTGIIVGAAVTFLYYFFNKIAYNNTTIVYFVLVCLGSGAGSMLGYDKVSQTVKQIAKAFNN